MAADVFAGMIENTNEWRPRGLGEPWLPDSFMAELSPDAVKQIERHGKVRRDIESISLTGDGAAVSIVLIGVVKVVRIRWDGKHTLVHVAGMGDVLNAEVLLTGNDMPRTMFLGQRSTVLAIPRRRFGSMHASSEEIRAALARCVAQRMQEHEMWRAHAGRTVEARAWALLVGLARRHGMHLDLTQAEIASALGASCSAVEGAMRNLRAAGKIATGYASVSLRELPSDEELDQSL
jgi:CRP/FNR family transcriptional regulator, cyclic AMP receptor protein